MDPSYRSLTFTTGRSIYVLYKSRSSTCVSLHSHGWLNSFIRYLHSQAYEIPLIDDTAFVQPKKTCPSQSLPPPVSAVPVSNAFEMLASPSVQLEAASCASLDKPPMVFKRNIPPISIKTSDPSALAKLHSVLHPDTVIHYTPDRLRLRASTIDEYKTVLDFVNGQQWEFYTFNPVVQDSTKSVLRDLPPTTTEADIRQALQDKGITVLNVRQLWKSTQSSEGVWSRTPLSVWYITHSKDYKSTLRALVGLLHFRIRVEEPKKRGTLPQCFRCLEFGHHANFCKQQLRCRICADTHDSRACPTPQSSQPKCHN